MYSKIRVIHCRNRYIVKWSGLVVFIVCASVLFTPSINAHSGRTDASGGHNCNVGSCAGTYHYHNGGGYTAPSAPNYYEQGLSNGRAHAAREESNIISKTHAIGYKTGYNAGVSGAKSVYESHPESICDISFTFDPGTNESYKEWYKSGWLSGCNKTASMKFMRSYDEGYDIGIKNKPVVIASNDAKANSSSDSGELLTWVLLAGFIGWPIIAVVWDSVTGKRKKY